MTDPIRGLWLDESPRRTLVAKDPASMRRVQDALSANVIEIKLLEQEARAAKE